MRVAVPGAAADFECCGVRVLELGQCQLFEFPMSVGGARIEKVWEGDFPLKLMPEVLGLVKLIYAVFSVDSTRNGKGRESAAGSNDAPENGC